MKKIVWIFLLFLSVSCSKKKPTSHTPIFPITTAKVVKQDVPIYLETIGNVEPIITVNVISRVLGEITGVYFTEGDLIKKGDLLFTIDPRTFEANVEQAKGSLQKALANVDIAREKVLRFGPLTEEDYYAKLNFDELKSQLHALEGSALQAKASLDSAKVELSYCWIYAPVDGRAGILQIDKGNVLKGDESQTLVTINQIKPIYISFFFPEKDLALIQKSIEKKPHLQTYVSLDNFKKNSIEGSLEMINNTVDQETGTITLRSIFSNDQEELWPGKYVQVRLVLRVEKDALVIPMSAVNMSSDGPFVYAVDSRQKIVKKKVVLGERFEEKVLIKRGLKFGEIVANSGLQNIYPGAQVENKGDSF